MAKTASLIAIIGPGILVAATGVGAGDLATATFTGTRLGTAVLWAVLVGAALKYVLNEGLTRWQLATETTLLEGTVHHLGRWVQWFFVTYLIIWSYLVAMALMSACGVGAHAMFPLFEDATTGKIVFGIVHSLVAVGLVLLGGYKLFEKVMSVCIGLMFVTVVVTACAMHPPWGEVATGLLVPAIPDFRGEGLEWTIALLGGVGGTVTVLCYGYWIREEGRQGTDELRTCRIDLAVGYAMTALFGLSMVVIGSAIGEVQGRGAMLIVNIADALEQTFGRFGTLARWSFLIGAWGAFFSSLLGVWQSLPYLFADFWGMVLGPGLPDDAGHSGHGPSIDTALPVRVGTGMRAGAGNPVDTKSLPYRAYLFGIALLPMSGLFLFDFRSAVKVYAVVGALFIPMLVAVLLYLNGNANLVGPDNRNSRPTTVLLAATLVVFLVAGGFAIAGVLA